MFLDHCFCTPGNRSSFILLRHTCCPRVYDRFQLNQLENEQADALSIEVPCLWDQLISCGMDIVISLQKGIGGMHPFPVNAWNETSAMALRE